MLRLEDIHNLTKKHTTPDGYTWWVEETAGGFVGHLHEKHGPLAVYEHVSRARVEQRILGLLRYHRNG